jgi:hypothetical protein
MEAGYLQSVYKDVSFRLQDDVRRDAERQAQNTARTVRVIVFFIVVVPVLIEIISLGVAWIGYILSAVSITAGIYKAAKAMGWLKASRRDQEKAEEERKMKHYFWHCERNPEAFTRLKIENFEREAIERTRKEADALGVKRETKSR